MTVKLGIASPMNVSFNHVLDTGFDREEWDEFSEKDRTEIINDMVWDAIEVWEIQDDK